MAECKLLSRVEFFGIEPEEINDSDAQSKALSNYISKEDNNARSRYLPKGSIGKICALSSSGRGASRRSLDASTSSTQPTSAEISAVATFAFDEHGSHRHFRKLHI